MVVFSSLHPQRRKKVSEALLQRAKILKIRKSKILKWSAKKFQKKTKSVAHPRNQSTLNNTINFFKKGIRAGHLPQGVFLLGIKFTFLQLLSKKKKK